MNCVTNRTGPIADLGAHAQSRRNAITCTTVSTIVCFLSLSTAACMSIDERYPQNAGWRIGWVTKVASKANIDGQDLASNKCLATQPAHETDDSLIAIVGFSHLRSMRYQAFPIPSTSTLRNGDKVYVNTLDCAAAIVPVRS